jgi:hypothetical protein
MLTETQQGSNSGQSITHDSDPRKLQFCTVDHHDEVVEQLGTNVDLTKALTLDGTPAVQGPTFNDLVGTAPIVGPTMADLAGGVGNALRIYLQRAMTITDLTTGVYQFTMHWQAGAVFEDEIFSITMPELLGLMATQPASVSGYKVDISSIVPNWAAHCTANDSIIGLDYISTTPFSGPGVTLTDPSTAGMSSGTDRAHDNQFDTLKIFPDQSATKSDTFSFFPQPGWAIYLNLQGSVTGTYDFQVDVPLDAASIKAQMNDLQLPLQQGGQGIFYHGLLDAYCTSEYTFTGAIGMFIAPYSTGTSGVEPLSAASQLSFSIVGGPAGQFGQRPTQLQDNITDPTSTPPTYTNDYPQGSFQSFTGDQSDNNGVGLTFNLTPVSVASRVKLWGPNFENNVTYNIDIATLKALATPEQLASQNPTFSIGLDNSLLPEGIYRMNSCYLPMAALVGLDLDASYVKISLDDAAHTQVMIWSFAQMPQNAENYVYPPVTATHLLVEFNIYPKTTPGTYNNILCTKPYELRNRNNPAFRFDFQYALSGTSYDKILDVAMLVSQGEVDGKTLWTRCPSLCFGNTFPTGGVSAVIPLTFPAANAWTPENWQGNIIKMPDFATANGAANGAFSGPWNYVKFMLFNPGGAETHQDYSNWRLEITANAREL